jgi:hypothetical protein
MQPLGFTINLFCGGLTRLFLGLPGGLLGARFRRRL